MKIIITGSLGNIGYPLTGKLLAKGHSVTVITSNAERKQAIEKLGASAAIGSVSDSEFLAAVFAHADAVFAMVPPNLGGSNVIENTAAAGNAFATAFKTAQVKRVVMLSSIGADLSSGTGPIAGLHKVEKIYEGIDSVVFTFLRAGFFYNNFYNDVTLIKGMGILGANYPETAVMPLVHPSDIATAAVGALESNPLSNEIRYVVSDVRKPSDAAKVLGSAIGKPNLPWVEFTDEQSLQGMLGAGLPLEIAELYKEMGSAFLKGALSSDFLKAGAPVTGHIKLEDFAKEFASAF